jgi:hypothetical protein
MRPRIATQPVETGLRPTRLPVDRICERRTKSSLATYAAIISCVGQSRLMDACRPFDICIPQILKTKAGREEPLLQSHLSYSFREVGGESAIRKHLQT